jgi:hypothetical protein
MVDREGVLEEQLALMPRSHRVDEEQPQIVHDAGELTKDEMAGWAKVGRVGRLWLPAIGEQGETHSENRADGCGPQRKIDQAMGKDCRRSDGRGARESTCFSG